ncbi:uncharacterized protein LOC103927401 isoform X3 [Pyrus x bretschneideri]|uniref:uncharacterized protein LOC103927401 isoform X3 n=1 Tax=Pyrus x bretschneideri TaxID=225117 RepID=UPI00203033F3|nr:uncharacterized protein LOC103927401 isoform X3 [Pyrus x bretschneideri]
MAAWTVASRSAANMARVSPPKSASTAQTNSLVHRRGFATGGDRHGPGKVSFWEDPMHPSKWKEEQFLLVSLAGLGTVIYGGYKFFTKGKEDIKEECLDVLFIR